MQIVEKNAGSITSTQQFIWANQMLAEARTTSGALSASYFANGETVNGSNYYLTKDHLNSVSESCDASPVCL